jgi:S-(hydroxymethyl)glutathione dehydrogenase / alcohol dehydrogenase
VRNLRAVTYQGKYEVAVKKVPFPRIQDEEDVIVKITSTAICGSDLQR